MTELVAILTTGKGTWGHVNRLIDDGNYEKAYLLTNEYGKENFQAKENTELILISMAKGTLELRDEMHEALEKKIKGTEIAVNFVSGTGKEHMALMSALLKLGVGIRFVALTKDGVQEV
tara:strand:+ start:1531 stop:1887 length:357 start_codon:yes stop_codon:yes gene_type:complete